jgi:nucleoside-diphosphate-sugar epimerase
MDLDAAKWLLSKSQIHPGSQTSTLAAISEEGRSMRTLVIGGTGFSGPHVVRRLMNMGHEIVLFHRGRTEADLPGGVQHILGDREQLADHADEFLRFAPQVVLDMMSGTEQQARGVMAVFTGVAQRAIAISSQDVYRAYGKIIDIEPGPIEPIPLTEESPLREKHYPYREQVDPTHRLYHYEKMLVEQAFMSNPELPGTIVRYPMVYGPRDRQHRLFEYLRRMDDGRPAIVLGQGMADWRWTKGYVENVAAAVALAVTDERATGQIYNVGEEQTLTEAEWVTAIGVAAGWRGKVVIVPEDRVPGHLEPGINTAQHLVVDTTRVREELGYREVVARDEALRRTVAWERAHPPQEVDPKVFNYAAEDALLAEMEGMAEGTDQMRRRT